MPMFGMAAPHNPAQLPAAADFCRHNGLRFLALPAARLAGLPGELEGTVLLDAGQCRSLQAKLVSIMDPKRDSLRFYYLGNKYEKKVEHFGSKKTYNPEDTLMV